MLSYVFDLFIKWHISILFIHNFDLTDGAGNG